MDYLSGHYGGDRRELRSTRAASETSLFERRLVARLQAGEPEALGTLFEMHLERVFAFARHLLGSREDAEEVTSEAFLRAFERIASYRGDSPFRGWIFGITRNLCRDRLRQPRLLLLDSLDNEHQNIAGDEGVQVSQMDTQMAVQRALDTLPEDQRLVLVLCDVEEWDAHEVADAIERSLSATKSLLYRARRAMRARLADIWAE